MKHFTNKLSIMNWVAAKSYYIGYNWIQRFPSIVFIHNYLVTWSISIIISLILPLLFLFAPSSLHTTRTKYFFIICIVCLANMCSLHIQFYLISGSGEPNLSSDTCRFIVYISTFGKPIGIYLTFLFSIERLIQKLLPHINIHRQLFQQLFKFLIIIGLIFIFSIRLYEIIKLIPRNQNPIKQILDSNSADPLAAINDINNNSTDRDISFRFCFQSINIDTYAKILSFYIIQYWFEYTALIIIIIIFIIIIIQQCRLSNLSSSSSSSRFSINTKFYLCLSLNFILSELILLFFHFIVDDYNNNGTNVHIISLQFMLFIFNFRCIFLPIIICFNLCDSFKEFFYDLFILRSYLNNIDVNDDTNTIDKRIEPFLSSKTKTTNRFQKTFHRIFKKPNHNNNNNNNNNNEHLDYVESQDDL